MTTVGTLDCLPHISFRWTFPDIIPEIYEAKYTFWYTYVVKFPKCPLPLDDILIVDNIDESTFIIKMRKYMNEYCQIYKGCKLAISSEAERLTINPNGENITWFNISNNDHRTMMFNDINRLYELGAVNVFAYVNSNPLQLMDIAMKFNDTIVFTSITQNMSV
jgi:hypothetical protein